ncbi:UDP-N-acetylmuramate dehydrogenase [Actinomyces sp. 2119]|nr:UDP-N-acetylmuramate dehydrogenase [Actinomyces sp. 2119]
MSTRAPRPAPGHFSASDGSPRSEPGRLVGGACGSASGSRLPAAVEALARPLGAAVPVSMADLTTLRVGGPLGTYVEATTEAELVDAVQGADAQGAPLLVVGGGSNILVSDAGFDGVVVRDARQEIVLTSRDHGEDEVTATAGTTWDDLVRQAVASGWYGFAPLSGIPGTVGAAPVQNIGAYGAEVADLLTCVRVWDRLEGRVEIRTLASLRLAYRDSDLKRSLTDEDVGGGRTWGPTGRWVVLSVTLLARHADLEAPVAYGQLATALGVALGARAPAREVREAVLGLRRSKGMVLDRSDHDTWSAGSFFTNPVLTRQEARALPDEAPRYPAVTDRLGGEAGPGTGHTGQARRAARSGDQACLVKTSAAWLIEHAGFSKGFALTQDAPARLSTRHVLALTNRGGARAQDLVALRDAVVSGVRQRFGVTLVPEPVHVGF